MSGILRTHTNGVIRNRTVVTSLVFVNRLHMNGSINTREGCITIDHRGFENRVSWIQKRIIRFGGIDFDTIRGITFRYITINISCNPIDIGFIIPEITYQTHTTCIGRAKSELVVALKVIAG